MKIFLMEHPRKVEDYFCNDIANTPLSSSLITSSLHGNLAAHNHEVMVSEGFMGEKSYEEITEEILNFQPDIMGIHMIYQWDNHVELKAFCKSIKAKMKIKIIVYGFYAAFAYKDVLESIPEVNAVIIGEPETAFTEIAAGKILPSIPSLCYRNENNEIIKNKIEILKNLDSLAQPIRSKEILAMRETNIEGSRGCYNNCTFCYINNYYGKKCLWRGHSVDYISQEIEMLMQNYGKNRFYFTDPNFFGPGEQGKKRCLALAKRLKPYNIKFGIEARVNDIEEKTLSALVDAGLEEILIGLESGSQNCLDRLKKNTTVAQNEQALAILRKVGIEPNIGFIMFEPSSTLTDIRNNFEFLKDNELLNNLKITSNMLYHNQILLQGSECYKELKNLPSPNPYHVVLPYENTKVGILATAMREITNILFTAIAPIWSQYNKEGKKLLESYKKINELYIEFFENTLCSLEKSSEINYEDLEKVTKEQSVKIQNLVAKSLEIWKTEN
ncbi:MAG: radical SAM protein [Clostridiales bacterium]